MTSIRALLTPHPGKELRVKGAYQHHKKLRGAIGIKIAANDLEGAIAGSQLLVAKDEDDIEDLKDEVMADVESMLSRVDTTGRGVCVQASTLGSLEALVNCLFAYIYFLRIFLCALFLVIVFCFVFFFVLCVFVSFLFSFRSFIAFFKTK